MCTVCQVRGLRVLVKEFPIRSAGCPRLLLLSLLGANEAGTHSELWSFGK